VISFKAEPEAIMKQQNLFTSDIYLLDFLTPNYRIKPDYNSLVSECLFDMFIDVDNCTVIDNEIRDQAIQVLNIPKSLALLYQEELDYDISRAFDNALRDLMEVQFSKELQDHIEEQKYFSHYIDAKGETVSNFWEAERVVLAITRKELIHDYLDPNYPVTYDDLDDAIDYEQWVEDTDLYFKSYYMDSVFVDDEWKDLLSDYSEVGYKINKMINNKREK